MIYLSGHVRKEILDHSHMGVIITPNMGNAPNLYNRIWAADNGCFSQGESFKLWRYIAFLEDKMAPYKATCLFATAPDVIGDHCATWHRSAPILPVIRSLGYPAAFVAQNGIERTQIAWDSFDWLFLGGDTQWKLSQSTRHLVEMARQHGKMVHMGRVNSYKRLLRATLWGCDSADGTYIKFGPDANLPRVQNWVRRVNDQQQLFCRRSVIAA